MVRYAGTEVEVRPNDRAVLEARRNGLCPEQAVRVVSLSVDATGWGYVMVEYGPHGWRTQIACRGSGPQRLRFEARGGVADEG